MTRRVTPLLVPVVALVAVLVSGTCLVTRERGSGGVSSGLGDRGGLYGRSAMMGGTAVTGGVWFHGHGWHGRFLEISEGW
jgi:hypothetical protein